jgi:hypothetical protein
MQLSIEKSVLYIQLRQANRGHSEKSAHSTHIGHRGKSLIIIKPLLLLETTSHKTRFVVLKRSIRASLNLVVPLACDGTKLKRNNLIGHGKLPFRMTHSIPIRSRLKGNRKTIMTSKIAIRWTTMASKERRWHLIIGRGHIRRRNI